MQQSIAEKVLSLTVSKTVADLRSTEYGGMSCDGYGNSRFASRRLDNDARADDGPAAATAAISDAS